MPENPKQKEYRWGRDKEIVKLYPYLTMEEIGKKYDISRERVRQILQKAGILSLKT